jgi:regulator of sigma E protease
MLEIIFIIVLFSLLVIIHEWGHFIMARRNGVGVEEFGIGFPPYLWGKVVKGTLYSFNLLPLGGFVRLKGEDAAETGPGTFASATYWAKFKILLAGVFLNLVTAVVVLFVLCLTGVPSLGSQFDPQFLHPTSAEPKQLLIGAVTPGSPADKAGIKKGDFILQANGAVLEDDASLRNFTKTNAGQEVTIKVKTSGEERDVKVKLREPGSTEGYLGVGANQIHKIKYSPWEAAVAAVYMTLALFWATIVGVLNLLISIPLLIMGLFAAKVPAAAEMASGPLGIFFILQSLSVLGYSYVFLFIANIAVALAAFNVLPLPALDGGRLALITWQKITRRKISSDTEAKIHTYGFIALLGLMLLITVYDLKKRGIL